MNGGLVYLDASALVKLILPEPESEALLESLVEKQQPYVSSEITVVEVVRAARRASRHPAVQQRARQVISAVHLLRVGEDILERAASLDPPTLRSLDAVHLSSALSLGSSLTAMYVYDSALAEAAGKAGIHVLSPS